MEKVQQTVEKMADFTEAKAGPEELRASARELAGVSVSNLNGEALSRALEVVKAVCHFADYFEAGE